MFSSSGSLVLEHTVLFPIRSETLASRSLRWDATDTSSEVGWGKKAPCCLAGVIRDCDTCSEMSRARLRSLAAGMSEDFTQKLTDYKPNSSVYCKNGRLACVTTRLPLVSDVWK